MKKTGEQIRIENLNKKRSEILNKYAENWDDIKEEYVDEDGEVLPFPDEVNEIGDEILEMLTLHQWNLPVDFVLEELTKLGWAPCLLYDDNGLWTISGDGMEEMGIGEENEITISTLTHFVEKEKWYPSIREALRGYLSEE